MKEKCYTGKLVKKENFESYEYLGLEFDNEIKPLAELVSDDRDELGEYLWVRYYTSEIPIEEPQKEFVHYLYGGCDSYGKSYGKEVRYHIRYHMHYSDITGYLWTDEYFNVGGHNILEELEQQVGKYLYMLISYSKEFEPNKIRIRT